MTLSKYGQWCTNLRIKCFLIGYMNLFASIVDIGLHFVIIAIASNGFQCDITEDPLSIIDWPWLEPFLLVVNLGTHGFFPFSIVLRSRIAVLIDYMPNSLGDVRRCYPGMFHVRLIDILKFMINVIWLKFVLAYVVALHKKELGPMRMFFGLSFVKLVLQILFSSNFMIEEYWLVKLIDILLAALFLFIIREYTKQVREEKVVPVELPPPYIECLINGQAVQNKEKEEKKETEVAIPEETKTEGESAAQRV